MSTELTRSSVPPIDAGTVDERTPKGRAALRPDRAIVVGGRRIPVAGPRLSDPRLHLAAVIVSVIVIGLVSLDFRLSIPQILVTVAVCALVEAVYLLATTGTLTWPASGMQTAAATVLIVRVVGVEHGDWWSVDGLHWFVGTAVFGLATKYLIRWRGSHIFNPSNVALVTVFIVGGATRVEPLDYWWGPLGPGLAAAYAVILVGGFVIGTRLGLLRVAVPCWVALAVGVGALAALGQSITARWSFGPIEGWELWRTILLSPETLIFVLFMTTDPRTVPRGPRARTAFGLLIGVCSAALMAPWPTEFGSKVGLLAGLVVVNPLRFALDHRLPVEDSRGLARLAGGGRRRRLAIGSGLLALAVGLVVVAGIPNWQRERIAVDAATPDRSVVDVGSVLPVTTSATEAPMIDIDPEIAGLSQTLATDEGARELIDALRFNLDVEAEAILGTDAGLLEAVAHGQRLLELIAAIDEGWTVERWPVTAYQFDSARVGVVFPGGFQSGPNAAVSVRGRAYEATVDSSGAVVARRVYPLETTFTMRQTSNGTWLTTGTSPLERP